jgi:hypothetical protein
MVARLFASAATELASLKGPEAGSAVNTTGSLLLERSWMGSFRAGTGEQATLTLMSEAAPRG